MRFRANPQLEAIVGRQPEVRHQLKDAGEQVKRVAIGVAPRGLTDDYVHSIDVVEIAGRVFVRTNDFAGHMVEFGSVNNEAYAPIRRGVRAAGLRLKETSK
jgi:hypothetical protein